jgi:hypothetical protein
MVLPPLREQQGTGHRRTLALSLVHVWLVPALLSITDQVNIKKH